MNPVNADLISLRGDYRRTIDLAAGYEERMDRRARRKTRRAGRTDKRIEDVELELKQAKEDGRAWKVRRLERKLARKERHSAVRKAKAASYKKAAGHHKKAKKENKGSSVQAMLEAAKPTKDWDRAPQQRDPSSDVSPDEPSAPEEPMEAQAPEPGRGGGMGRGMGGGGFGGGGGGFGGGGFGGGMGRGMGRGGRPQSVESEEPYEDEVYETALELDEWTEPNLVDDPTEMDPEALVEIAGEAMQPLVRRGVDQWFDRRRRQIREDYRAGEIDRDQAAGMVMDLHDQHDALRELARPDPLLRLRRRGYAQRLARQRPDAVAGTFLVTPEEMIHVEGQLLIDQIEDAMAGGFLSADDADDLVGGAVAAVAFGLGAAKEAHANRKADRLEDKIRKLQAEMAAEPDEEKRLKTALKIAELQDDLQDTRHGKDRKGVIQRVLGFVDKHRAKKEKGQGRGRGHRPAAPAAPAAAASTGGWGEALMMGDSLRFQARGEGKTGLVIPVAEGVWLVAAADSAALKAFETRDKLLNRTIGAAYARLSGQPLLLEDKAAGCGGACGCSRRSAA